MSENSGVEIDQSFDENSPTGSSNDNASSQRKTKKTTTRKQVQKRGLVKQSELDKWTIFVRPEVKMAVQKASKKASITDTAWLNQALWDAATSDLKKQPQTPAKVEDVADVIKQFAESMKAQQEATAQVQNELIAQQGQQIAALTETIKNRPATLKEMLFGKSK